METPLRILLDDKGHKVESITLTHSAYDAAKKMADMKIGALLVMTGTKLEGIVSERDILRKVVVSAQDPKSISVSEVMTRDLTTVTPATTVREAMRIVTDNRIRHLPVLENGQLIGMISIGDLTRWAMLLQEQQIASLTKYIQS